MKYVFATPLPIPAMVILTVVGIAGIVGFAAAASPLDIICLTVFLLSYLIIVGLLIRRARQTLVVTLSESGWIVRTSKATMTGVWHEISQVSATNQRLRLVPKQGKTIVIEPPQPTSQTRFKAMLDDFTAHLDKHGSAGA